MYLWTIALGLMVVIFVLQLWMIGKLHFIRGTQKDIEGRIKHLEENNVDFYTAIKANKGEMLEMTERIEHVIKDYDYDREALIGSISQRVEMNISHRVIQSFDQLLSRNTDVGRQLDSLRDVIFRQERAIDDIRNQLRADVESSEALEEE